MFYSGMGLGQFFAIVRCMQRERTLFRMDNCFFETKIYYADSTGFNILTYNFIEGERSSCIKGSKQYSDFKNSAEKYFAKERPVMDATLRTVYDNQGGFNNVTYVLLKPRISAEAFNKKRLLMDDKYMAPIFASSI